MELFETLLTIIVYLAVLVTFIKFKGYMKKNQKDINELDRRVENVMKKLDMQ